MTKRAWLREPLLTALIILTVFVAWLELSTINAISPNESHATGFAFAIRLGRDILFTAAVLAPWIGLAILGNFLLRRRGGFGLRLLVTFVAAEILCLPIAIWAGTALTRNDGWRGLGALSFAAPVIAPVLTVLAHLLAAAALQAATNRRDVPG
jgi:hypothetical protein